MECKDGTAKNPLMLSVPCASDGSVVIRGTAGISPLGLLFLFGTETLSCAEIIIIYMAFVCCLPKKYS